MNGAMIRKLRERMGITQSQLSELMNVDQGTVSRWERDIEHPRPARQAKLRSLLENIEDNRHLKRCVAMIRNDMLPATILDRNLRLIEVSKSARGFFASRGQDADKLMGRSFFQYLDRLGQPELIRAVESAGILQGSCLLFRFSTNYHGHGNLTVWEPIFENGDLVAVFNFVSSKFEFSENEELSIEYVDFVPCGQSAELHTLYRGQRSSEIPELGSSGPAHQPCSIEQGRSHGAAT